MRIISGTEIFSTNYEASIVTVGNFDGVHRGHRAVFRCLRQAGAKHGLPAVAVTFDPHPMKVLAPTTAPKLITTSVQKAALIAATGIDGLVVVPFNDEFSRMSADAFVERILCSSLGMRHIVIGHDYAFGRGREGNFSTLERLGTEYGFTVEDLSAVGEGEVIFSSSLVRSLIARGEMASVPSVLGRYYMISGTVVHGREIGLQLGYPTANIATLNELIPPDGVYAVMVRLDGALLKGACSIGINPTFSDSSRTIEVFLLDFSAHIYGREIEVFFVQRLRSMQKFSDVSALKASIANDIKQTRLVLEEVNELFITPLHRVGSV
ncbi:MAG TPA: bifunctional riboflavin kinase/FAD synthetase [Desulfuromonadales bacterium]|nr:bifunctional riboflavin kinase/FAD synthetase [Desulfuromonadales bacterium]